MAATLLRPVDKSSPIPLYHQAASEIERAIRSGAYSSGSYIEGEFELARLLDVSRLTVRRAVGSLVDQGLLVRERGVGTRVLAAPRQTRQIVTKMSSLFGDLARAGLKPETRVLRSEIVPCPPESVGHLEIEYNTPVLLVERLRLLDGEPIALMWNVLAIGDEARLDEDQLIDRSLYAMLREIDREPRVANQTVTAIAATPTEAKLLDVAEGSPLLLLERVGYDGNSTAIEHARTRYVPARYAFEMRLVAS